MSEHFLDKEAVELLRRERCRKLTADQFAVFLHAIDRFQLDPFAGQIHAILRPERKGSDVMKLAVQTGIDGFRLVADRTGRYAGNDDPTFDNEAKPLRATVTVYKIVGNQRCPFTASARWAQYCPYGNAARMWDKMPHLMLGKCAESLALRKAFPAELSGLYTHEEMQQADTPVSDAPDAGKPNGTPPRDKWGSDENRQPPATMESVKKAIAGAAGNFARLREVADKVGDDIKSGAFNADNGNELEGLLNQQFLPLMDARIDATPEENCDRLVAWIIGRRFGTGDETRFLARVTKHREEMPVTI